MHYKYITMIGNRYTVAGNTAQGDWSGTGEEGKSGHRTNVAVWMGIQNKLKKAIVDRTALMAAPAAGPAPAAGLSAFEQMRAKFEAFQSVGADNERTRQIEKQTRIIQQCRRWLQMEGAEATVDGDIKMGPMNNLKVYYDHTALQQNLTRVHFQGGRLFSDAAFTKPISTRDMVTHFSGPGYAIYVMSAEGNLHLASHVVGHYHHSSLLAGQPVAGAGEIKVHNGTVEWISNKSGHYTPNPDHLCQVLHQLQKRGCDMGFRVRYCSAAAIKNFNTVGELENWLSNNGFKDFELGKLLSYSRYLTKPAILRVNGWKWVTGQGVDGVYTIAGNTFVAHKTVRKWFKANQYKVDAVAQSGAGR